MLDGNFNQSNFENFVDCLADPDHNLVFGRWLGMDSKYAEVTLMTCDRCGQTWLKYFFELEAFSYSGRWYLGPITADMANILTADDAVIIFEIMNWYYYGGSYFGGRSGKTSGALAL